MKLVSNFVELFRAPCPERQAKKLLSAARLQLVEYECHQEDVNATVLKLRARVARLEGQRTVFTLANVSQEDVDTLRNSFNKSAPSKGPDWETSNGMEPLGAIARRRTAGASA